MQQFLCKGDRRFDPQSMAELTSTVRRQKLEVRKKQTFVSTGADRAKEPSRTETKIRVAEETRGKLWINSTAASRSPNRKIPY